MTFITQSKVISSGNSTTTPLGASATFTGTAHDDVILCDTSSNAVEVDLLPVATARAVILTIVRKGANNVTVDPDGSEEINGEGAGVPFTLSTDRDVIRILHNGTEWFIV